MLNKIYLIDNKFHEYFGKYDFHNLYKELLNFCTVDLSSFYFDIRKDTLYCDAKDTKKRQACIKLLNIILGSLIRWFAPILSFTTEEIFKLVEKKKKSIHLESFKRIPEKFKNEDLDKKWFKLKKFREICNSSIEKLRTSKEIGSSLEVDLKIELNKKDYKNFKNIDFAELCITSSAELIQTSNDEYKVSTKKAAGEKCSVCWKLRIKKCERPGCGLVNEG